MDFNQMENHVCYIEFKTIEHELFYFFHLFLAQDKTKANLQPSLKQLVVPCLKQRIWSMWPWIQ